MRPDPGYRLAGREPALARLAGYPEDARPWEHVAPRRIQPDDWARFEGYMSEILTAFGLPRATPGTATTPQRFLPALHDATVGYEGDHKLLTAFPTECLGGPDCRISQIIEGPIAGAIVKTCGRRVPG